MRIVMMHNRYRMPGGEDVSVAAEAALLRSRGHKVDLYELSNEQIADLGPLRAGARTVWSQQAYEDAIELLEGRPVDILHVQNFFPLISPSVYYAARRAQVPVVQSLRNYRLICPNGLLYRDGKPCEDCIGRWPWPGVLHSCYRGSHLASGATAAMLSVHRFVGTWVRLVDVYIALSAFARGRLVEGGVPARRVRVKPNFVFPDPGAGVGDGNYALYVGRLTQEKGVRTLISAWRHLRRPLKLLVAGDGPLREAVTTIDARKSNVRWLGQRPLAETYDLIGRAAVLVMPSELYETFGRVIVEAYAKGTPVVASRIGAVTELVEGTGAGWLFSPGDDRELAAVVDRISADPAQLQAARVAARQTYESHYSPESNYEALRTVYRDAIRSQQLRLPLVGRRHPRG